MLNEEDIERIATLWVPEQWPAHADYYAIACHQSPFRYYVERIRHLGLSGGTLIDAGCGSGRWSFALATTFDRVIGFDFTPKRLDTALWLKERFDVPSVSFIQGDIRNIPADDRTADAVYSNSVAIGSVPIAKIFTECFRVLKPGGICYVGLNGPGYAHQLAKRDNPKDSTFGRQRIYNTHCQRRLASMIPLIRPRGVLNARARRCLVSGRGPAEFLRDLGAEPEQIAGAEAIASELGSEFKTILSEDLAAIIEGRRRDFSHPEAGRDYDPQELQAVARKAGFDRFEWAQDGCLSLRPDGTIQKGPSAKAKPTPGEFEGRLRVFEMLMWKPPSVERGVLSRLFSNVR
jgi:SAM-dependent methyltransferase